MLLLIALVRRWYHALSSNHLSDVMRPILLPLSRELSDSAAGADAPDLIAIPLGKPEIATRPGWLLGQGTR